MLKKVLCCLALCLMVPAFAYAGTVTRSETFGWTYSDESEAEITCYEIYQYTNTSPERVVIGEIPKSARFATGPITYDNGTVNRFYIRALNRLPDGTVERSDPSDVVRFLATPGQFKRN